MNDFHNCIQKFLNYETGRAWVVCGGTTMSSLSEGPSRVYSGRSLKEPAGIFSIPGRFLNLESRSLGKWASPWRGGGDGGSPTLVQNGRFAKECRAVLLPNLGALPYSPKN